MKNIKQRQNRRKIKHGTIVITLILLMFCSGIYPLVNWGDYVKPPTPIWYDPELSDFLYEDDVNGTIHEFNAYDKSYIICKIRNRAFTNFTFNDTIFDVAYGLNSFPVDFGTENASYTITIEQEDVNNDVYEWIIVEPAIIAAGEIEVNPDTPTSVDFYAGGFVSILIRMNYTLLNNFSYDKLYLEYDGTILNEERETIYEFLFDIDQDRFNDFLKNLKLRMLYTRLPDWRIEQLKEKESKNYYHLKFRE